jgi:hypothetical protein
MCDFLVDGIPCNNKHAYAKEDGTRYCRLHKSPDMHHKSAKKCCFCRRQACFRDSGNNTACAEHANCLFEKIPIYSKRCTKCRQIVHDTTIACGRRPKSICDIDGCTAHGGYMFEKSRRCFEHATNQHIKHIDMCIIPDCYKRFSRASKQVPTPFCNIHKGISEILVKNEDQAKMLEFSFSYILSNGGIVPKVVFSQF